MMFRAVLHSDLSRRELECLRDLFDGEYFREHGPWDPDAPYEYAPADVHVIAASDGRLLGHVGFQLRSIAVDIRDVVVAGTGGVLVRKESRGIGLGAALMRRAQDAMRSFDVPGKPRAEFGYLGCRPEVVPFYQATGWRRIDVVERHVSMGKKRVSTGEGNAVGKGQGSAGKDPANAGKDPGEARDSPASIVVSEGEPVLICAASRDVCEWPAGPVDLRGKPW
jgi:Acetyltransferase (GNAT) family.